MEWKFEYLILIPLGWSLLQGIQHGKILSAMKTQMGVLQNNVTAMSMKFDIFLKTETDVLKEALRENTSALKDIAKK